MNRRRLVRYYSAINILNQYNHAGSAELTPVHYIALNRPAGAVGLNLAILTAESCQRTRLLIYFTFTCIGLKFMIVTNDSHTIVLTAL